MLHAEVVLVGVGDEVGVPIHVEQRGQTLVEALVEAPGHPGEPQPEPVEGGLAGQHGDGDQRRKLLRPAERDTDRCGPFGVTAEEVKDLTVGAVLGKLLMDAKGEMRTKLIGLIGGADRFGLADEKASKLLK